MTSSRPITVDKLSGPGIYELLLKLNSVISRRLVDNKSLVFFVSPHAEC